MIASSIFFIRKMLPQSRAPWSSDPLLLLSAAGGGVESITTAKSLLEKDHLSRDCVLMVDETYLLKGTQFHSGGYIGTNVDDELYKGIMVFMITDL